jgi:cytochrome c biogenesis protein
MRSTFGFLSSLRLTIFLLIAIIILAIIGTLIPQGQDIDFYRHQFPHLSSLIISLKLNHLYRSPLFLSLVFLFLLNLLFCTLKNLPLRFRRLKNSVDFTSEDRSLTGDRHLAVRLAEKLEKTPEKLRTELKKRRYQVKIIQKADQKLLLARKGLVGLFGTELVHLGLLVIILGGLASALFSERITLALSEGQSEEIMGKNFRLRLDKFITEFYPDGSVKDWKSLVSIIENDQVQLQKAIEVNHPLRYRGLGFYQTSYGYDWGRCRLSLELKFSEQDRKRVELSPGERLLLDQNLTIVVSSFIPDFQIDQLGQAFSRSAEPRNPAALVEVNQGGQQIFFGWIFYHYPEQSSFHRKTPLILEIRLLSFTAPQFSVLEASSDPGTNLVWIGSFLLLLGLMGSFYLPYRELKIIIRQPNPPLTIFYARKNRQSFLEEIERIIL